MRLMPSFAVIAAVLLTTTTIRADTPTPPTDAHPVNLWLDVDTANGIGEVDDGLMMIAAFHSPEVRVVGVSSVFGNAPVRYTYPIALNITRTFGPSNTPETPGIPVAPGAAGPEDLGKTTPAVDAMAKALKQQPLTILAVGPVTNVATLIEKHPELVNRIQRIVMCAARRSTDQKFLSTPGQPRPFKDANFEHDPKAMRVILDTKIPLVFAGWEVASHVWLTRQDINALRTGVLVSGDAGDTPWNLSADERRPADGSGLYIHATIQQWIDNWENKLHAPGGNPFDTLSLGYVIHPDWFKSYRATVRITNGPKDQPGENASATKPYLIATPADETNKAGKGREALYLVAPAKLFKPWLLIRLGHPTRLINNN